MRGYTWSCFWILCFAVIVFPSHIVGHTCSRPAVNVYVENNLGKGCVALVRGKCTGANKHTDTWVKGLKLRENCATIPALTAVATFRGSGGTKYNGGDFKHAAIYTGVCDSEGVWVYDQYEKDGTKIGVNHRKLGYISSPGYHSNNGDYLYVIL